MCLMSQLYIQYRYKFLHATFCYLITWYFTLCWDFSLWRLVPVEQIQWMFVDSAEQWPLPSLPSACVRQRNVQESPPFFLRHSTYITTKSSFGLMWSCSSADVSSTQALCLHVTLLSNNLKKECDFSNCRKFLKRKNLRILNDLCICFWSFKLMNREENIQHIACITFQSHVLT